MRMHNDVTRKDHKVLFNISIRQFALPGWILPLFGFVFCVGWSIMFDFKASTATHCRVRNYLPSISSAIGGFSPQRYVWRICIGLHSWIRLGLAYVHYHHFSSFHVQYKPTLYRCLVRINAILNVIEILALVFLSMISSSENYALHENSFITFMVCSLCYMLLTCILYKWSRSPGPMTEWEARSFRYKTRLFLFNITSFFVAVYFYYRHMAYCESGVYTLFALGEYLTVISNIVFHCECFASCGEAAGFSFLLPPSQTTSIPAKSN